MNPKTEMILSQIESYLATGVIPDALVPYYDQHGKWIGAPSLWFQGKHLAWIDRIKLSYLPASRRISRDRSGTILRTSYIWRGSKSVRLTHSGIEGSFIVEGDAMIHAPCLRHVGGNLISSTNKRVSLPNLRTVGGNFEFVHTLDLNAPRLQHVDGRAKVVGSIPPLLTTVGRSLGIYWCYFAESKNLKSVGDYLCLTKADVVRFHNLETIGGGFLLTLLTHVVDAPKLRSIGGDFLVEAAHDLRLPTLRSVGGIMDTSAAKGFYDPRITAVGNWITYPGDIEDWHRRDAARKALKCKDILL